MSPFPHQQFTRRIAAIVAVLVLGSGNLRAQDIFDSPPPEPLLPAVAREAGPPPLQSQPPGPPGAFFQYAGLSLHPGLSYQFVYGLGLPADQGRHVASEIHTLTPDLEFDAGKHWSLDYTPTWIFYTARALKDSVGQSLRLSGADEIGGWNCQLSESYSVATPILAENAQQTQQIMWSNSLGASRSLSSRLQFDTTGSMTENLGDTNHRSRNWTGNGGLTVQISPRTNLGFSVGFGYVEVAKGPDTYNENYTGRLAWVPTDTLNLSVSVGEEVNQSWAAAVPATTSPLLNFSLGYQPFRYTSISVSGGRTISNSFLTGQTTTGRSFAAGFSQRLLGRYYLSLSFSNQQTDYGVSELTGPAGRTDRQDAFNARITTQIYGHWSVAASYQRGRNTSNQTGFTYPTTQYGLELSCKY